MQKISVAQAVDGVVIAQDIIAESGVLLLKKGATFQRRFLTHFIDSGVKDIYIEKNQNLDLKQLSKIYLVPDKMTEKPGDVLTDVIHDKTRQHAELIMKKTMLRYKSISSFRVKQVEKLVGDIISEMLVNRQYVIALSNIRSVDDYTYQHSVNVAILALIIGVEMHLAHEDLIRLGVGAMLHDVGKVMISEDILKKPSKLTAIEYDEVKLHTLYGYNLLKEANVHEKSAEIALYHHEKVDGTGYYHGLKDDAIPLFARIVSIADVYDAMTNDRIYKSKIKTDKVYREVTSLGGKQFDQSILEIFAKTIHLYPPGMGVVLNSGQRGVVIEPNVFFPESPKIRVFTPQKKSYKSLYFDLDLSRQSEYFIKETF